MCKSAYDFEGFRLRALGFEECRVWGLEDSGVDYKGLFLLVAELLHFKLFGIL